MDVRQPLGAPEVALHWALPHDRTAPAEARRRISEALIRLLSPDDVDAAVLVTSELVTNVLLHARTDCELDLWLGGDCVVIRVTDRDVRRPVQQVEVRDELPSGRGLAMVDVLCGRWGVDGTEPPAPPGKTVWCELAISR